MPMRPWARALLASSAGVEDAMSKRILGITLAAALMLPAASAHAAVPAPFVGMVLDGPVFKSAVNLPQEMSLMAASGVQSVRLQFAWEHAQPYPAWEFVPQADAPRFVDEGGIPTDWGRIDQAVTAA